MSLILFSLFVTLAEAQRWPSDYWHDGKIVLVQGDTLKGPVKYDLQQNVVLLGRGGSILDTYSARKVLFFEIFDVTANRYRQFYALPFAAAGSYETLIFFEFLEDGKLTLLSRESVEYRTQTHGFYGVTYSQQILVYQYFFLSEKGQLEEFSGGKTELLNLMGRYADHVDKYMRANKLRIDDKYDFARIVAYYNSLQGT
ncbi:MAG TPA: hypothetical protein VKZ68_04530 [Ohtaekwangia sp.]|nr:hypothetical protein [Ohtaekwangia sp.]